MRKSPEKNMQDTIIVDPDGTVCTSFARTGYLGGMTKVRYGSGDQASIGAFSVTTADQKDGDKAASASHALVFVSESAGEEKIAIVERFESLDDASSALQRVTAAIHRYVRSRRRRRVARTVGLYAALPFVGFVVAMSAVRFLDSHQAGIPSVVANAQANDMAENSFAHARAAQSIAANFIGASQAMPATPVPNGAFATPEVPLPKIHFGQSSVAKGRTLYVYADPNCPACKRFESHLQDLAKDYSVYVLPVPFKDGSLALADKILCSANPSASWQKVMEQAPGHAPADVLSTPECSPGYSVIRLNAEMYKQLDFKVTPMVVDDTGFVFPEGATATAIRAHIQSK